MVHDGTLDICCSDIPNPDATSHGSESPSIAKAVPPQWTGSRNAEPGGSGRCRGAG